MSVKVTTWVWEQDLPPNAKIVLLAVADHADDDGGNSYPSHDTLAKKTGFSTRQVKRVLDSLVEMGYLAIGRAHIPHRRADRQPNMYTIFMSQTPRHGVTNEAPRGDIQSTTGGHLRHNGVTNETERGDIDVLLTIHRTIQEPPAEVADERVKAVNMTLGADPDRKKYSDHKPRPKKQAEETQVNQYRGNCHRCGELLQAGEAKYLGKNSEGEHLLQCPRPCEDKLGKKKKHMDFMREARNIIEKAAKDTPVAKYKDALFEMDCALSMYGSRYATLSDFFASDPARIFQQFGADSYQFASEVILKVYGVVMN